jgi:hypothetical protein
VRTSCYEYQQPPRNGHIPFLGFLLESFVVELNRDVDIAQKIAPKKSAYLFFRGPGDFAATFLASFQNPNW